MTCCLKWRVKIRQAFAYVPRVQGGSLLPNDKGATSPSWAAVSIQTLGLQEPRPTNTGTCGPSQGRCGSDPGTHHVASSTFCGSAGTELNCAWIWGWWTQGGASFLSSPAFPKCRLQVVFSISYVSPGIAKGFCAAEGDRAALPLPACPQHVLSLLLLAWPCSVQGGCFGGWQRCL